MLLRVGVFLVCGLCTPLALGATLPLPPVGDDLAGEIQTFQTSQDDTLPDVARAYSIGFDEINLANPKLDTWVPGENAKVTLPLQFILPMNARSGVVVNVPEMRIYYFPPNSNTVITYPVSIGRMDWNTPLGKTQIVRKDKDPVWIPPVSIKQEHLRDYGEVLPDVVPAGVDNPLGGFALRLGVPGYLIHGTDRRKSYGIGIRATHGCMRLYPEDIASFFGQVEVKTSVELVSQPVKLGWQADTLYLEVHPTLEEDKTSLEAHLHQALQQITAQRPAQVDLPAALALLAQPDGLVHPIGHADPSAAPQPEPAVIATAATSAASAVPQFLPAQPAHIPATDAVATTQSRLLPRPGSNTPVTNIPGDLLF